MPAPKGSKNAKAYQDAITSKNKASVEGELAKLKEARANFESITALSQAIAKATGLTDVTIRRNKAYRVLIIKYINEQGGKSGYMSRAEAELNKLRHKVTELELRLSNASADNGRLQAFISKMQDSESSTPQIEAASSIEDHEVDWEQDCHRTYSLVQAILSRAFFEINFAKNTIEDRTGIEENEIIAGANISQPFIGWCKRKGLKDGR
ncbi:hypothetical protein C1J03_19975 [Sulfitobacter sp. SK012]|uniref:hypothetical protein n=1 Tax=Sulfitobacter sp. SK012 TaxID=1389005 RepID=UPI000E0C3079|nr:hypothetical protein [Sulfitobacter sp. SK012]AXI48076.1 hypothetical protein C1J03_19975 [Sulfitobacter sp. SK012]